MGIVISILWFKEIGNTLSLSLLEVFGVYHNTKKVALENLNFNGSGTEKYLYFFISVWMYSKFLIEHIIAKLF